MIEWSAFLIVFLASLVSACLLVTLFAVGLRLSDGGAPWRRPASVTAFVLCGLVVAFGIYLIVPVLHG
ncbi:MAG: hypothetical protein KF761_00510 [Salinibacterium sp.]|nr:hypothetical protein [Salinibacterium sp.]